MYRTSRWPPKLGQRFALYLVDKHTSTILAIACARCVVYYGGSLLLGAGGYDTSKGMCPYFRWVFCRFVLPIFLEKIILDKNRVEIHPRMYKRTVVKPKVSNEP